MIYLFDKDEKLIKIVKKEAIKTALQKFALTTEKYVSDRLTVEMKELSKKEFDAVEYMAIQSIEDAHTFHYFYIAQKFSENLTTLIGVQSGIEELRKSVVLDKRPHNTFARPIINELLAGTNWQARFVSETSQRSTNFYYISTFEALKKVCQVWNLEMQFFVEVNGNKIGARYIDFKEKIGEATGKRVVYGHNALQILQEVERTNLFTALIGRGKGEEISAPSEENTHGTYGRRITFEDVVWEKAKGAPVDKPKGQKYVELPEMTKRYGIKNADGSMRAKVGFAVFEDEEDKNALIRRTYDELVNASRPQLTLKTSTVYLKGVKIGDTIRVVRHDKKLDYDTRIFEITFNRLNNKSSDIKLGDRISESNEAKIQSIASQKADELISNGFKNIISKLPEFLPSPDGFNNNWYGKDDPTKKYVGKVLVNDIWFKPDPEHEGQTILLRWTGEVWEEIIRSNSDQAIIDEISKRFKNLNFSGVDEAKAKAEEALKKAGASADLAGQAKELVNTTKQNLDDFKNQAYTQFITEDKFNSELSSAQTELKKYVKEETDEKTSAIRETISRDYVAKSTFTETVEGTRQRFEALTRDNEAKLAEYKQGIDGRITDITSQVAGKVNQVDFQRVRETAQLYERILGSSESDISRNASRLVMSDQVFQTEVGKYVTDDNNLIVNSMTMNKHTLVGNDNPNASISVNDGIFTIKAQGLTGYNWSGFSLPIYVKKIYKDETYTLGFKYRIREYPDVSFAFNVKNHGLNKILLWSNIGQDRPPLNEWQEFQKTFTVQEDFAFGEDANYPFYIYLAKNGWIEFKEPILVRGSRTGTYKPSQFDDAYKQTKEAKDLAENAQAKAIEVAEKAEEAKRAAEATRTQVTQLAGSWSVKNLNSAGDVLGAINLNPDGSVKINEGLISVGEKTYIKDGVIKKSMIGNAQIGTAHIGEIDASQARIINISAKNIVADGLTANVIRGGNLSSLNGATNFDLQSGWLKMNGEGVGIFNQFDSRPIQYLVFHKGAINGKLGSYTALMSNSHGWVNMDDGSAGIQIWNTNDNTTAINLYGDEIAMMYNANDPKGIIFDNVNNEIKNVETMKVGTIGASHEIWIKGKSLAKVFDLINQNFIGIENWFKRNKLGSPGRYDVRI
jgi:phage minor structural protein, N-terminal domain protein